MLMYRGFIPYLQFDAAREYSRNQHFQFKNLIAGHIKRNDPVSRRLVQYLAMQACHVVLLVRDTKTGKLLVTPDREECWLVRQKVGVGRNAEWRVLEKVDDSLFEHISGKGELREWQFGFTYHYDVIIWDLVTGRPSHYLQAVLQNMLVKAHRVCEGEDLHRPMASVLQSVHQEPISKRVRDARPGEPTLWEDLKKAGFFVQPESKSQGGQRTVEVDPTVTAARPDFFYSEEDAAEAAILFLEDLIEGKGKHRVVDRDDAITMRLERHGPNWKRLVYGLDSDDDSDDCDDELTKELYMPRAEREAKRAAAAQANSQSAGLLRAVDRAEKGVKVDERGTWQLERGPVIDEENNTCTCNPCAAGRPVDCEAWSDEEDFEDMLYGGEHEDDEMYHIALRMDAMIPERSEEDDPEKAFFEYLDRDKAKVFIAQWHIAATNEAEKERYCILMALVKTLTPGPPSPKDISRQDKKFCLRTLIWLDVPINEHRVVWKDLVRAFAMTSIFFPQKDAVPVDLPEELERVKSQLADNALRAEMVPSYDRDPRGNLTLPSSSWSELDEVHARSKKEKIFYLRDWDKVVRPMVAHWFKTGIIEPAHIPEPAGDASVRTNSDGKQEVVMDYRATKDYWPTRANFHAITDPATVDIVSLARKWHDSHGPKSRFALLRVWSDAYFYPLMLGMDNRENTSFKDQVERSWQWRFVPKDMPGSEFSMQKSVELRLDPFKRQFGKQVVVKRDIILILANGEEELRKLVLAVAHAVQTRPWRMEIDLRRSFVNVELRFLDSLGRKWLD